MKKVFLVGAIALFGALSAQSGFKLGAHVGLPVGDAATGSSVVLGVDAAYMFPVAAEFNLGLASGYSSWLGKNGGDAVGMVPIAGALEYKITPQFSLGADLGYAFLMVSGGGSTGGFYYQPKAAYHFGPSEVYVGYMGITKDGATASAINLGYAYSFGK